MKRKRKASAFGPVAAALTVKIAAERLGVPPRVVSDTLASIDPQAVVVPIIQRRRRLAADQLADLRTALEARGILNPPTRIV